jgi:hypothetical protein
MRTGTSLYCSAPVYPDGMSRSRTACAVLFALIVGSAFGGAGGRADLVVSAVSLSQHGRVLQVTDVVRNRGDAYAGRSTTAYYLARRQIGHRIVRPLRPGAVSRGSVTLTIARSVRAGSWRLRVCADSRGRIREMDERNNCRLAARVVVSGDVTPPQFIGLERATTCVPGPIGGNARYTPYNLRWTAATDNATPPSEIVYDVYHAENQGGEQFAKPTYTTPPGATSFTTPPLADNVPHYFVVRARDKAGNEDRNDVERLGTNLCL